MNKLLLICGMIMLGNVSTPQEENLSSECDPKEVYTPTNVEVIKVAVTPTNTLAQEIKAPKLSASVKVKPCEEVNLNDILFIEEEEEFDLGFDTADYLPEGFNPNEVYFDLDTVTYVKCTEEFDLGFDTANYLPEDFNAYAAPKDFQAISYMEEEDEDLGFETQAYLPENFDPYEVYFDINSVEYIDIEEEEEAELDFNTLEYLPKGFDPYSR